MSINKVSSNISLFKVNLVQQEFIENVEIYRKFVNWVSGEYDLYFQDETDFLKVYFPNGYFNIKNNQNKKIIIEVKGMSSVNCEKIMAKLQLLYNNMMLRDIS